MECLIAKYRSGVKKTVLLKFNPKCFSSLHFFMFKNVKTDFVRIRNLDRTFAFFFLRYDCIFS
jgi:hypothetical protein